MKDFSKIEKSHKVSTSENEHELNITHSSKTFRALSDNLYKNKIESIVREVAMNSVDGSRKANINTPVEIRIPDYHEYRTVPISFQDFGIGMSLETVIDVFCTYFNSTKDDDGNQNGGFGLGGKTPFIYTDEFFIETTCPDDGIRRFFIMNLDKNGIPTYSYEENLDKVNSDIKGTKVYFFLKDSGDVVKFASETYNLFFSTYPINVYVGNDHYSREYADTCNPFLNDLSKNGVSLFLHEYYFNNITYKKHYNTSIISQNPYYKGNGKFVPIVVRSSDVIYSYDITNIDRVGVILSKIDEYRKLIQLYDYFYYRMSESKKPFRLAAYTRPTLSLFVDCKVSGYLDLVISREFLKNNESNEKKIYDLIIDNLNVICKEFYEKIYLEVKNLLSIIVEDDNYFLVYLKLKFLNHIIKDILKIEMNELSNEILETIDVVVKKIEDKIEFVTRPKVKGFYNLDTCGEENHLYSELEYRIINKDKSNRFFEKISITDFLDSYFYLLKINYNLHLYNTELFKHVFLDSSYINNLISSIFLFINLNDGEYEQLIEKSYTSHIKIFNMNGFKNISYLYFIKFKDSNSIIKTNKSFYEYSVLYKKEEVKKYSSFNFKHYMNRKNVKKNYEHSKLDMVLPLECSINKSENLNSCLYSFFSKSDNDWAIKERNISGKFNTSFRDRLSKNIAFINNDAYDKLVKDGIIKGTFAEQLLDVLAVHIKHGYLDFYNLFEDNKKSFFIETFCFDTFHNEEKTNTYGFKEKYNDVIDKNILKTLSKNFDDLEFEKIFEFISKMKEFDINNITYEETVASVVPFSKEKIDYNMFFLENIISNILMYEFILANISNQTLVNLDSAINDFYIKSNDLIYSKKISILNNYKQQLFDKLLMDNPVKVKLNKYLDLFI